MFSISLIFNKPEKSCVPA